jgi:hypothetical protein
MIEERWTLVHLSIAMTTPQKNYHLSQSARASVTDFERRDTNALPETSLN